MEPDEILVQDEVVVVDGDHHVCAVLPGDQKADVAALDGIEAQVTPKLREGSEALFLSGDVPPGAGIPARVLCVLHQERRDMDRGGDDGGSHANPPKRP
jgi:hypothetical protein